MIMMFRPIAAVLISFCLVATGCKGDKAEKPAETNLEQNADDQAEQGALPALEPAPPLPDPPPGLDKIALTPHDHNPTTAEKVALGELLFFDKRLSDTGTFACVTCHLPEKGWTDGLAVSPKANGKLNTRHSPTLYNVGYATEWYWDGRSATLEEQILAAWGGQMSGTPERVAAALSGIPMYRAHFQRAFGEGPTPDAIVKALASFVRIKLRGGDSPWDRHEAGEEGAVSEDAIKGYGVFLQKAACAVCHMPPLYTDMKYHNVGVGYENAEEPDPGRFKVTQSEAEIGAFKTPGLRGVALTGPYFHDGSAATLEEAVDFMLGGGYREGNKHIDPRLQKVELSAEERAQLLAFLQALTPAATSYAIPRLP
jgi:cytochrome c peroxidase